MGAVTDDAWSGIHLLKAMLKHQVYIDPLLANTYFREDASPLVPSASEMVSRMSDRYLRVEEFGHRLNDIPFSPTLMRHCLKETLLSTSVAHAYTSFASVEPTKEHLVSAAKAIHQCVLDIGVDGLYTLYFLIAGYDMLQPLYFYSQVPEADFLDASRHYPYRPEHLDVFLLIGLARKNVRMKRDGTQRMIQLTRLGRERFQGIEHAMSDSGYTAKRVAMSHVYQFDSIKEWDDICCMVWPDQHDVRRAFIDWLNIPIGANVLEVACGTGSLTFDAGLYQAVGPHGRVVGVDVSTAMLEQAEKKHAQFGFPPNVSFRLASVKDLPYESHTFDVCVGSAFLHVTSPVVALKEMARVVVPGGVVGVVQGLEFSLDRPFLRDWFEPIYHLARKQSDIDNYLATEEHLIDWFSQAGIEHIEAKRINGTWAFDNPEVVVQHLLRGVSFVQTELFSLPYDYRRTLINELIDRGRDVCRRYPLSDRKVVLPCAMVLGRTPDTDMRPDSGVQ